MAVFSRGPVLVTAPIVPAFPCAGAKLSLLAPNDLTNVAWTANSNSTSVHANSQTDPLGGGAAGDITAIQSGGVFVYERQNVTLLTGTTYQISGYVKAIAGPSWAALRFHDTGANVFGSYFDFSAGKAGTGIGTFSCAQIQSAGNGFWQFSLAGSVAAVSGQQSFDFNLVNADAAGLDTAANNQEFYYYFIGP